MSENLMTPQEIETVFTRFAQAHPDPRTELVYHNVFTLLVAVVLSAQATDRGVNKATEALFEQADTPEKMLKLGEEGVRAAIKSINFYPTKARHIIGLSQALVEKHGGAVPPDRAALEALPGVGRKTANVVLNVYFGQPTMAVDTHIFRVSNRTGLAPGATPLAVEEGLISRIPAQWLVHAHHWLILHGRYTCTARKPQCATCILVDLCHFTQKNLSGAAI